MLINLSNHPSSKWQDEQLKAAVEIYGNVLEMPFPIIDPDWNTDRVEAFAIEYTGRCSGMLSEGENNAIHIMGELTFTFHFVTFSKLLGISCIASTTSRIVKANDAGEKISVFKFIKFRNY
jgi:hypothetical protein